MVNDLTPDYKRYPIPNLQDSNYDLGRRTAIGQLFARAKGFKSSFYLLCLLEWDRLDQDIRQSRSLDIFKSRPVAMGWQMPPLNKRTPDFCHPYKFFYN